MIVAESCEKCGKVGVPDSFYGRGDFSSKAKRFCSVICARSAERLSEAIPTEKIQVSFVLYCD